MCIIAAVHKVADFNAAVDKVNEITSYQGSGHSCGIYTNDMSHVEEFALRTKTSRVMVRQPQVYGNSGNWDKRTSVYPDTRLRYMGERNISSENITWKHFINTTWVSLPIPEKIPDDAELFSGVMF